MSKLIAVCGAPGSGKTTTAIQLALALSRGHRTLLVLCDAELPPKEYLFEKPTGDSLGKVVSAVELSEAMLLRAVMPVSDTLGVIGYNPAETALNYPSATVFGAGRFCEEIGRLADFVVFDLANRNDTLAKTVLQNAASVVCVLAPMPKDMVWKQRHHTQTASAISVLNHWHKGQPSELPDTEKLFVLPYCAELKKGFGTMDAFKPAALRAYRWELTKLLHEMDKETE